MKKLLSILILSSFFCLPTSYAEKNFSLGETLTLYFSELFPNTVSEINNVTLKYSGIGNRNGLRVALQKAVYYGMLSNTAHELHPDSEMSDRAFCDLLRRHFGVRLTCDTSSLTLSDYEAFMVTIRTSFAYRLLHLMNTPEISIVQDESVPESSKLANANNYYLLEKVYSILQESYLRGEKFDQSSLIYGAAEWLVNELGDQHTKFFRPDASTDFRNSLDGNIVGIGVIIDVDAQWYLLVTDVIRHSPAEKAGILAGDKIIKIDNNPVITEDGIDDDIARLRGKVLTQVEVTLLSGKITKTVAIIREIIHVSLVETETLSNAYRIIFWEVAFGTDALMRDALRAFLQSSKKRLILDLRNNPGWSMEETRNILNYFIDKGNPLVILKYPKLEVTHFALDDAMTDWTQYEIVILINSDSASAAEIIASSLREYFPRNVVIIGDTSYGKWTVQELVSFDDKSLLKYTIAEWITPFNKLSIDQVGVVPDKRVVYDKQYWRTKRIDTQLLAAQAYEF
jgi:carboxyl-terminal processing protease